MHVARHPEPDADAAVPRDPSLARQTPIHTQESAMSRAVQP
jgi:hypothetical protein